MPDAEFLFKLVGRLRIIFFFSGPTVFLVNGVLLTGVEIGEVAIDFGRLTLLLGLFTHCSRFFKESSLTNVSLEALFRDVL